MNESDESPEGGLNFSDNISVAWKVVEYRPDDAHLALVNESNESFLRAVSALGEYSSDSTEDEAGLSQEILRLDLKINLILDLVSRLIYEQLDLPEMSRATISSTEIQWHCVDGPRPGQIVFVEVYIQHGMPKPMCFYGEVVNNSRDGEGDQVTVRYLGLAGSTQSWLDKLIFRHHRRAVAFEKSRT